MWDDCRISRGQMSLLVALNFYAGDVRKSLRSRKNWANIDDG